MSTDAMMWWGDIGDTLSGTGTKFTTVGDKWMQWNVQVGPDPRRTARCPAVFSRQKSVSLVLEEVLQSDEAGGPSAAHSIDGLTDKLDDGGEKEMYSVLWG